MSSKTNNLVGAAIAAALAIFGYWIFLDSRKPIPEPLQEISGKVESAEANGRKGGIHTVHFTLENSSRRFAYSDVLPDIKGVWSAIDHGADATVVYQPKGDDDEKLWGLKINGKPFVDPVGAHRARQRNGLWGLLLAVLSTIGAPYMYVQSRKRPTVS